MRLLLCIAILFFTAGRCAAQTTTDKDILLQGVGNIVLPDTPHYVYATVACNDQAQVIATAVVQQPKATLAAFISSRLGKGKILILGSDQYLRQPLLDNKDDKQLIINSLSWGANTKKGIQLWGNDQGLSAFLQAQKLPKPVIDTNAIRPKTGVLILTRDISDSVKRDKVETFIREGGTLIFGSPIGTLAARLDLYYYDTQLNKLFIKAGLYHIYMPFVPADNQDQLQTTTIPAYLQVRTLLKAVTAPGFQMKRDEADAYASTLSNYLYHNEDTAATFREVEKVFASTDGKPIVPSPEHPISKWDAMNYLSYEVQEYLANKKFYSHPDAGYIDPASKIFPGAVDPAAKRVDQQVEIPVQVGTQGLLEPEPLFYRWHSTGLYIPAGEKVKVTIDSLCLPQHLKALIGVHDDNLQHMDYFTRNENDLTKTFELTDVSTDIYSPFGGLLLIKVPDTSTLKKMTIRVSGAVRAPFFKLGVTSSDEWKQSIRNYPGPWAELATDKIILTVPSYRIRQLDDPEKLMRFWDEVMDADARLASISTTRIHPERIIIDQQVAYGYMFTEPWKIMAPDDASCTLMLDEALVRQKGSWGHFHELGHRHQFWGIDFDGLGEVTTNLYTMYVYDKVLHKGIYNHENIPNKEAVIANIKKYMGDHPSFEKFRNDPFLALSMYIELIENFGWQSIEQVFATFRQLPKAQYPPTEADKRDYWFTCMSRATGKDLSAFFDKWQVPVTEKAKTSVKDLPTWLPEELK